MTRLESYEDKWYTETMDFEKIAAKLQQRIAQLVMQYESDIASMQTQYEAAIAERDEVIRKLTEDKDDAKMDTTDEGGKTP